MKRFTPPLLAAATLALSPALALAQTPEFFASPVAPGVPQGGVGGLTLIVKPEFAGAQDTRVTAVPTVEYQWANGFFAGVSNGVGYNFSTHPAMSYGARVTVDLGRKESLDASLQGMGNIAVRPELGLFANTYLSREWQLTSSLRYGSGTDRKGLVADVGAYYGMSITPGLRVTAGVAATWANAAYHQSYFGVSAAQASTSSYSIYTAGAGVRDLRASVSGLYAVAPRWYLVGTLSTSALQGDAKDSPLVQRKSGTSAWLTTSYSF